MIRQKKTTKDTKLHRVLQKITSGRTDAALVVDFKGWRR